MNNEFGTKLADEIKKCPDESAMNEIVSQNLKDIMESYDLKAFELAAICNCSPSGVYRWLTAKNTPKFVMLYPLCRALGVPMHAFAEPNGVMKYLTGHKDSKDLSINGLNMEEQRLFLKFQMLSPERKKVIADLINTF